MKVKTKYSRREIDEKLVRLALEQLNNAHKSLVTATKFMKLKRMKVEAIPETAEKGGAA